MISPRQQLDSSRMYLLLAGMCHCVWDTRQCFFFSGNTAWATPIFFYFLLSKNIFSGSKYPKNKLINFEKRNADTRASCGMNRTNNEALSSARVPRYTRLQLPASGSRLQLCRSVVTNNQRLIGHICRSQPTPKSLLNGVLPTDRPD